MPREEHTVKREFKKIVVLWLGALGAVSGCARSPAVHPRQQETTSQNHEFLDAISDLDKNIDTLAQELLLEDNSQQKIERLNQIRITTRKLKKFAKAIRDRELWEQYCDAILGIAVNVESQLQHSYWSAARNSFERVRSLKKQMIPDSGLTHDERTRLWLKRLF